MFRDAGPRLSKKDRLKGYGDSYVKDKTDVITYYFYQTGKTIFLIETPPSVLGRVLKYWHTPKGLRSFH